MNTTLSFLAIGILTLIIAYINFINFSVAMAPVRVRALNIRKILGADLSQMRIMIASEAFLFSLISLILAVLYIHLFKDSPIKELFSADLSPGANFGSLSFYSAIVLLVSFLLGFYPAFYITSFNPILALKGTATLKKKGRISLQNILITIQFIAAISLVIISSFIKFQHDYMQNYSWGIQKENIAYVSARYLESGIDPFGDELMKDSRFVDYTASQFVPGSIYMGWGRSLKGKQVNMVSWPVRSNFLGFFGVTMYSGKDFADFADKNGRWAIFNKEFLHKYEFGDTELFGEKLDYSVEIEIIGVANDINFESLRSNIRPMVFVTLDDKYLEYMYLKMTGEDIKGAIKHMETIWGKFSKEPFDVHFLDNELDNLYKSENNLAKLISVFSLIAILIAVMGVYGLITFNAKTRAKEIGIRKINGASVSEIILLLNRGMLIQLAVASCIAIPISYYIVKNWIENFAYRTSIDWWVFLFGALLVIAVALVTASIQSYRAAIANPAKTLKNE